MKHAFISYSRKNADYAHKLKSALTSRNLPAWIDEHIPVGTVWPQEIHKAIGDSFAVIVLMTPDAARSSWVQKEVLWAEQKGIPRLPLLVHDCDFLDCMTFSSMMSEVENFRQSVFGVHFMTYSRALQ